MKKGAAILVLVHLAVLMVHGAAHSQLKITATLWQKTFITAVIFIIPLVATIMLWTSAQKLGIVLLGASLGASLAFGVSYHFLIPGLDNALGQYRSDWGSAFRITAILLALIEAAGLALSIFVLPSGLPKPVISNTNSRSRRRPGKPSLPLGGSG